MTDEQQPSVIGAGEGRVIVGPTGPPMIIKAGSADTHDAYALIEYSHAAGAEGPTAHVRHEHEEAFYVIDGQLTLEVDGRIVTVETGGFAVVPRGAVHRPSNRSDRPVRFFFIASPAADGFFVEMGQLATATGGRPSGAQLREIGDRRDTEYVDLDEHDTGVHLRNEPTAG